MTSSNRATTIRLGSYQLAERVGEGGSAHVYRAVGDDGSEVAIKLLSPSAELDDDSARARFEREIRVLAELRHPAVVQLLDSGIDDELGPYLVTPLLPGATLRALQGRGPLGPEAAALLLEPLADGLAAVHRAGLVHRDVKPENVIVTPEGRVVLVDLGLAYRAGQTRYTEQGSVVGSVPYMAPEQLEGREVSAASDVWALAVILYELITGARPFARERTPEEAAAILVGTFVELERRDRRVAPALSRLVSTCLVHAAPERPSAEQVRDGLRAALDWVDAGGLGEERAMMLAAPAAYAKRIALDRAAASAAMARRELEAGNGFAALRAIDRGLAYRPNDPALTALAERAEVAPATTPAPSRRSGRRWIGLAIGALVLAGLAAIVARNIMASVDAPARSVFTTTSVGPADEPGSEAGMELARGLLDVFSRGLALGEEESRRAKLAEANLASAVPPAAIALPPLSPDELPNDGPARLGELAAAPGQPLVSPSLLGGADPAATLADFDRRVASSPDDVDWAVGRMLVYLAAGHTDRGLALLDDLTARWPDDGRAQAARGFVEMRRGRYREAEAALDRALARHPEDAEARRNRGILRNRLGRVRDAYADLVLAVRLAPGDAEALRELAGIYSAAGRPTDARAILGHLR
ncbi:MAG TPA: protein kinase [Kofleriaceae bacterium]|nr:protein kinase [Kofleriaceae bacterium]